MQDIERCFEEIGVSAQVGPEDSSDATTVNVLQRPGGELFEICCRPGAELEVLDADPGDRHLLLRLCDRGSTPRTILCGHDERAWFAAAIPETAEAGSIQAAKDALKPQEVWDAIREFGVPMQDRDLRRTAAFIRQGEWFFIPRQGLDFGRDVLRNEPIQRGAGKPHLCQFLHRTNGIAVYVNSQFADGITLAQRLSLRRQTLTFERWRIMQRGASVHVRGAISHPDHETIHLRFWHQVVMNTESQAAGVSNLAFLD